LRKHFPAVNPKKIVLSRLGVAIPERAESSRKICLEPRKFTLLTVGRLHAVKDHAFLIRACARLRDCGLEFECAIAGEGPERRRLESLIREHRMQDRLTLLGYVPGEQMDSLYRRADLVVLTSRSEGIPLVLMEAMARGKVVLAPAITGIPEIVIPGKTGFLYAAGELEDFVTKLFFLEELIRAEGCLAASRLDWLRYAARLHIAHNFNHGINLAQFCDQFLKLIAPRNFANEISAEQNLADPDFAQQDWSVAHENSLLQQV
jgi:glycosyltransferase involved in cell wall biosynthesis